MDAWFADFPRVFRSSANCCIIARRICNTLFTMDSITVEKIAKGLASLSQVRSSLGSLCSPRSLRLSRQATPSTGVMSSLTSWGAFSTGLINAVREFIKNIWGYASRGTKTGLSRSELWVASGMVITIAISAIGGLINYGAQRSRIETSSKRLSPLNQSVNHAKSNVAVYSRRWRRLKAQREGLKKPSPTSKRTFDSILKTDINATTTSEMIRQCRDKKTGRFVKCRRRGMMEWFTLTLKLSTMENLSFQWTWTELNAHGVKPSFKEYLNANGVTKDELVLEMEKHQQQR